MKLEFKRADLSHMKLIFDWRNDPVTREFAHQTEPLVWEQHSTWFQSTLKNPKREIYIVNKAGVPAAMIRRDREENSWLISIVVSPESRGQGVGKAVLTQFVKEFPDTYFAEIKPNNQASINSFSAAGFKQIETPKPFQVWKYVP